MTSALVVTLYGRPGCHLCDAAEEQLRKLARELHFALELIDIEQDDELHRRFMFEIPVVAIAGDVIAAAPISQRALEAALRERVRRRRDATPRARQR
ncbi:MAG: glutaredoxin family protein [Chloroflexi bacterium]|nr:glutaredoxin family protein [Chloroflexota bacterium]